MRRFMLFLAIAGAVAYFIGVSELRRNRRRQDEAATSTWENEGGAAPREA